MKKAGLHARANASKRRTRARARQGTEERLTEPDPTPPPSATARILLVEDEPNVRKMLERFLSPNYVCLGASNGKEALEVLKAERDVDLVVTDVRMPQMDGIQLLK